MGKLQNENTLVDAVMLEVTMDLMQADHGASHPQMDYARHAADTIDRLHGTELLLLLSKAAFRLGL